MRQIGVSYSGFVDESYTLLSLFDDVEQIEKDNRLQTAIDVVREQFGFLAIQKGTVLTEGSRNIERSKLIGGHRWWIGGIKMIDRSSLPFQSAREYQDTKMQKWMGFFLSEHASALSDDTNKVTYMSDLSLEKKLLLLSQVYAGQLRTRIQVIEKNKRVSYTGTIPSLTKDFILIKTTTGHINLKLKDIISIELVEEVLYESA